MIQKITPPHEKSCENEGSVVVTRPSRSTKGRINVYSQLWGLEDVSFNDLIQNVSVQKVMVKLRQVLHPFLTLDPWKQRSRLGHSKESRISKMFLKHWVTTSVTPECLSRVCLRLLT
jgi:hypothetical protein